MTSHIDYVQLLEDGRRILIENGWQQHGYGYMDGPFCIVGAVRHFTMINSGISIYGNPYLRLLHYLKTAVGLSTPYELAPWNDTAGRKFSEVIDAYDRAIILAKEDAQQKGL